LPIWLINHLGDFTFLILLLWFDLNGFTAKSDGDYLFISTAEDLVIRLWSLEYPLRGGCTIPSILFIITLMSVLDLLLALANCTFFSLCT
jgi:hypothetical protein